MTKKQIFCDTALCQSEKPVTLKPRGESEYWQHYILPWLNREVAKSWAACSWERHRQQSRMQLPPPCMWQACRGGWQCCRAHRQGSCAKGHSEAPPAQAGWRETRIGVGVATGVLSPRGSPIVPYPGLVYPDFTTLCLEDFYKAPVENPKIKLSKRVFNALKRVFYRYYQKCECCELGLQRNTYPSSSCFCSILSGEKAPFYPMNQFIILCSQPWRPRGGSHSCPGWGAALQKAARTKAWGCRLAMVSKEDFLINSLWGFCKTK